MRGSEGWHAICCSNCTFSLSCCLHHAPFSHKCSACGTTRSGPRRSSVPSGIRAGDTCRMQCNVHLHRFHKASSSALNIQRAPAAGICQKSCMCRSNRVYLMSYSTNAWLAYAPKYTVYRHRREAGFSQKVATCGPSIFG